jgi:hypothetical protein
MFVLSSSLERSGSGNSGRKSREFSVAGHLSSLTEALSSHVTPKRDIHHQNQQMHYRDNRGIIAFVQKELWLSQKLMCLKIFFEARILFKKN